MNVHELTLQNYAAGGGCPSACQPMLYLGTAGSYGNEQINVVLGEGWQGLTVKAVFQPCGVAVVVPDGGGVISVPWEATQSVVAYPHGRISFQGYVSGRLVNTSDVPYTVGGSSAGTDNTPAPTPDEFQQFVDAVKSDADRAAQAAADAEAAVQKVTNAGTQAVADIGRAKDSALEAIDKAREEAASSISADVEGAKQAATDAEKSAANAKQAAKDATTTLANVQAAGKSALDDIATELQNTLSDIQNEGTKQQSAVAGSGTAALEAIGQTEQAVINQVKQAGATQVSTVQSAGATQINQVNSAGTAQVQAVKDEGAVQTAALNDAAEAHKNELESIASHPPQPNTATGKWQVWNAETGAYQDTDALYQGGYYTAAVSDDGVLTWQGSQPEMPAIPSANIKGPKGDKGDPGLGVPSPTQSDAGKVPTVKADGSAYELAGPYAPLSAAIRPTASGNPVSITDSVEWPLQGFKIYGKSTQDGTPSPENPVPIVSAGDGGNVEVLVTGKNLLDISKMQQTTKNGITFSLENGGIRISGTATAIVDSPLFTFRLPAGTYISNINKASFPWLSSASYVIERAGSMLWLGATTAFTILDEDVGKYFYFAVSEGQTVNEIIYPQLEVGPTATPYEPYKSQSPLTISTPTGLSGIPVDSGGNYTDAEGQQWVCDEIDYARGVYVQRIQITILDSLNFKVLSNDSNRFFANYALANKIIENSKSLASFSIFAANALKNYSFTPYNNYLYFRMNDGDAEQVDELFENAFPAVLVTQLATSIETPLSEDEIAAYKAIHTYDGATVVSTAEDVAGLEVKYVADAQKYIDDRLAAAESHIQEIAAAQLNAQTGG